MILDASAVYLWAPVPENRGCRAAIEETTRHDDLSARLQAITASSLDQEFNGHQRAALDPSL
jgi:hypothetical protein